MAALKTITLQKSLKRRDVIAIAVVVVLGILVGTLVAAYFHEPSPADQYDAESVRDFSSRNRTDEFIAEQQARLRANANDWQADDNLAVAFLQKARETGDPSYYTKAEGLLERALKLNPKDFQAMSSLGSLALSRHQFREALDWGLRASALNPYNAHNFGVIGDAQIELGRYDEAVQTFQKMIDIRPDLSSYSRVSYARELYGDLDGAIEAMQQAVDAGGPNAENTNWVRVQLGNLYFNRGQLDRAERYYQEALANYPDYVHGLAALARVRAAQGRTDEALELYAKAVEIIPLPQYLIEQGDLYTRLGKTTEAARAYDLVRFEQQLARANGVDVDLELALFDADHNQNLAQALAQARVSYERRPSIHAADVLAWTLYRTGNYTEADRTMQEALRLGTRDPLMFYHQAMIAYRLGREADAIHYLDQALTQNPYFSMLYAAPAQQLLTALRNGQHPDIK